MHVYFVDCNLRILATLTHIYLTSYNVIMSGRGSSHTGRGRGRGTGGNGRGRPVSSTPRGAATRRSDGSRRFCPKCRTYAPTHDFDWCPEMQCFHCGVMGHSQRVCNQLQCFKCKGFGHIKEDCYNLTMPKYLKHASYAAAASASSISEGNVSSDSITASPSSASVSNNASTSTPASASHSTVYDPLNVPGVSDTIIQGASASNTASLSFTYANAASQGSGVVGCIKSFATVFKRFKQQVAGGKRNLHQKRLRDLDDEEARLRSAFNEKLRKIQEAREIIQEEARVVDIVDLNVSKIDGCVEGLVAQSQTGGNGAPVYEVPAFQECFKESCIPIPPPFTMQARVSTVTHYHEYASDCTQYSDQFPVLEPVNPFESSFPLLQDVAAPSLDNADPYNFMDDKPFETEYQCYVSDDTTDLLRLTDDLLSDM